MIANSFVTNAWYVAGLSAEFATNKLHGMVIAKKPIVIWRTSEGKVVAFDDRCVHKRMPLSCGRLMENGTLECAYHGFTYDGNGQCVKTPSQPNHPIPSRAKLKPFPVIEQEGAVWVWTGDPDKMGKARPPRTPELTSGEWETYACPPMSLACNYRLLIENLLDVTHFYPLHDGNIGDLTASSIPIEFVEQEVEGNPSVMTIREVQNYQHPPFLIDWFGYETVDRHHSHCMSNPGLTRVRLRCAPPGQLATKAERGYILHHTHTPVDETHHVWRWIVSVPKGQRAADGKTPSIERIKEMFPGVVDQDRWALERQQQMFNLPDDGYQEVHLRADKSILILRKILESLEKGVTKDPNKSWLAA